MGRMTTRTRTFRTGMADPLRAEIVGPPLEADPEVHDTPASSVQHASGKRTDPRSASPAGDGPDGPALWRIASWLSPAYPVGAFACSHGLEAAVAAGDVRHAASAGDWIADCIEHGSGRSDAILLAHAWRAEAAGNALALAEVAELATALAPSAERLLETTAPGAAFAQVTGAVGGMALPPAPYPVAVGQAAARQGVPLAQLSLLFLHGFASNLVSAGVRLVPLGQTDGQRVLASLLPLCERMAKGAMAAGLDETGGCAFRADIAAMRHETQPVRLFRT